MEMKYMEYSLLEKWQQRLQRIEIMRIFNPYNDSLETQLKH